MTRSKATSTPNTVPRALTPALLEFCGSIAPVEPVLVPSSPLKRAATSFCFENVAQRVEEKGGSSSYGWAIWHMPGLYFEAEHHGVWRNKLGNLIDVSPQMGGRKRLLFLPDESAVYDPFAILQNVMPPDGESDRAKRTTELGDIENAKHVSAEQALACHLIKHHQLMPVDRAAIIRARPAAERRPRRRLDAFSR